MCYSKGCDIINFSEIVIWTTITRCSIIVHSLIFLFTVSLHCILTVLTHRRIGLLRQSESISADQKEEAARSVIHCCNCLLLSTTFFCDATWKKSNPFSGKGMRHKSKPHHAHTIWKHSTASPQQGPAKSQPIRNFWSFLLNVILTLVYKSKQKIPS